MKVIARKKHKTRRQSVNKYAHLVPARPRYDAHDKTFRVLPVLGGAGKIVKAGVRHVYHGRVYELIEDVMIYPTSVIPEISANWGRYKLVRFLNKKELY